MSSTVTCTRCGRSDAPALTRSPLRGPLGARCAIHGGAANQDEESQGGQ